jgi:hypothetical protein
LRAIFTAFSTASAPELTRIECFSKTPGVTSVLVRGDSEQGVGQLGDLLGDGGRDIRMRVADCRDADSAAEIDELVAVDVDQDGTRTVVHVDVRERSGAARDAVYPALLEGDRLRSGQFGHEPAFLRHAEFHAASLRATRRHGGCC